MTIEYARHYRKVRKAVGPQRRDLVWGSMIYACSGSKEDSMKKMERVRQADSKEKQAQIMREGSGCGFERRVQLGVGCEGPPYLKEADSTIPVPFIAGCCQECGGTLQHVRWDEDENYGEERERAANLAAFLVPGKSTAARYAARGFAGAELLRTAAEEAALQRFHGDQHPEAS